MRKGSQLCRYSEDELESKQHIRPGQTHDRCKHSIATRPTCRFHAINNKSIQCGRRRGGYRRFKIGSETYLTLSISVLTTTTKSALAPICTLIHAPAYLVDPAPYTPSSHASLLLLSPVRLQTRHNNRPVLDDTTIRPITLTHKVRGKTQPATTTMHVRLAKRPLHRLRIISHDRHIVPPPHQLLLLPRLPVDVLPKDLHHVLLRIRGRGLGASAAAGAVGGDVERFVVVEELEDVVRRRGVDDGAGDELVHRLEVGGVGRVVHETRAACVHGAGEECEADVALSRDALKSAN